MSSATVYATFKPPPDHASPTSAHISNSCTNYLIRDKAVCARCEPDELARLEEVKYYRSYEAGQPAAWAGDDIDFVASVITRIATLSQTMEDGRTQIVGLMLPSDFVGRPSRTIASYDVKANSNLTLCCFRRRPFEKLLHETPHIDQRLLEMTLDELDAAREWMLILGRKTAREKIASLLTILAQRESSHQQASPKNGASFDLPLTRESMADYLGLTLETVSRQISALKRDHLIELQGKHRVFVPDFEALMAESGDDADGSVLV